MPQELREFVYLDTMSVNSLLASQFVAIPETVRDVSEDIESDDGGFSFSAGVTLPTVGDVGGKYNSSESEQVRNLAETQHRINHQYRFSILHKSLQESEQVIELDDYEGDLSFSSGDVVKIDGNCETDPFYRVLSAVSLISRIFELSEVEEETEDLEEIEDEEGNLIFDNFREVLHGQNIGLRVDSEEFNYPIVMSVNLDNLWVDPQREFLGAHDYTVVGRVEQVTTGTDEWDFVDLLRIVNSVFSDDTVDQLRDALLEVGESMGEMDDDDAAFDLDISRDDYVVDEPAVIVRPIAIYW